MLLKGRCFYMSNKWYEKIVEYGKKCIQSSRGESKESHHFGLILLFTIDKSELFLKYKKSSMSALV